MLLYTFWKYKLYSENILYIFGYWTSVMNSKNPFILTSLGMETCAVFWPVKLRESGRVLFFHFQLWDCGENAMRRFDHMLPVTMSFSTWSLCQLFHPLFSIYCAYFCDLTFSCGFSNSHVRNMWMPFSSCSPSLIVDLSRIFPVRFLGSQSHQIDSSDWWLGPSIL